MSIAVGQTIVSCGLPSQGLRPSQAHENCGADSQSATPGLVPARFSTLPYTRHLIMLLVLVFRRTAGTEQPPDPLVGWQTTKNDGLPHGSLARDKTAQPQEVGDVSSGSRSIFPTTRM
jgi:hypothetical protein